MSNSSIANFSISSMSDVSSDVIFTAKIARLSSSSYNFFRSGISSRQGGHQVAQKFTMTRSPSKSDSFALSPSSVSSSKSGAFSPVSSPKSSDESPSSSSGSATIIPSSKSSCELHESFYSTL